MPLEDEDVLSEEDYAALEQNMMHVGEAMAGFDYNIMISFDEELHGTVLMFVERDIDPLIKANTIAYFIHVLEQGLLRKRFMTCLAENPDTELADRVMAELEVLKRSQNYLGPMVPAQEVLKS